MPDIVRMKLFDHEGYLITTPDGQRGIFAWQDVGSRQRKRKVKGQDPVLQTWSKIWISSVYHSDRYPNMPWKFAYSGGKYPFCRCHFDPDVYVLFFDLLPFLYQEYFGAVCPWGSTPPEIKKEFKPKTEDDEVARLERELAGLTR